MESTLYSLETWGGGGREKGNVAHPHHSTYSVQIKMKLIKNVCSSSMLFLQVLAWNIHGRLQVVYLIQHAHLGILTRWRSYEMKK